MISSGTSISTTLLTGAPISSRMPACARFLGKPSSSIVTSPSVSATTSLIIRAMRASGTSCPRSMNAFASTPAGVPFATAPRRRSPDETCLSLSSADASAAATVPFPDPGAPSRMTMFILGI